MLLMENDTFFSVREGAKYLHFSLKYFYRMLSEGKIPSIKHGNGRNGRVLVSKIELDKYIKNNFVYRSSNFEKAENAVDVVNKMGV